MAAPYPWHVKEVPCPNTANCHDEKGHEMCHNCNPRYVKRDPCGACNAKADGGRWICCMRPTCYTCYDKVKVCPGCSSETHGYFRCNEEPENAAALIAASKEPKVDAAKLMEFVDQVKAAKREHDKAVSKLIDGLGDGEIKRDERIRVLKKLVFERMAQHVRDEMNEEDNLVYNTEFDEEWVDFDDERLTVKIDGKKFRFCLLPCEVVDALSIDQTYDIEPPKKKQKKAS